MSDIEFLVLECSNILETAVVLLVDFPKFQLSEMNKCEGT